MTGGGVPLLPAADSASFGIFGDPSVSALTAGAAAVVGAAVAVSPIEVTTHEDTAHWRDTRVP